MSVSYICVQSADLIGSRLLPDASCGVAFTLAVKLFTMVMILALDISKQMQAPECGTSPQPGCLGDSFERTQPEVH